MNFFSLAFGSQETASAHPRTEDMAAAEAKNTGRCSFCLLSDVKGRQHGFRFLCTSCESVDRLVRRNLGSFPEMEDEDRANFFTRAMSTKDGPTHQWKLVRCALKQSMVRRKVRKSGVRVDASKAILGAAGILPVEGRALSL